MSDQTTQRIERVETKVSSLETQQARLQTSVDSLAGTQDSHGLILKDISHRINDIASVSTQTTAIQGMVSWRTILTTVGLFLSLVGIGITMLAIATRAIVSTSNCAISHESQMRIEQISNLDSRLKKIERWTVDDLVLPHIGGRPNTCWTP